MFGYFFHFVFHTILNVRRSLQCDDKFQILSTKSFVNSIFNHTSHMRMMTANFKQRHKRVGEILKIEFLPAGYKFTCNKIHFLKFRGVINNVYPESYVRDSKKQKTTTITLILGLELDVRKYLLLINAQQYNYVQ